jgi:hypothetical protein
MNRKILFGCLGAFALASLAGILFLYVYVIRPASQVADDLKQLMALRELNAEIANVDPFKPPDSGALTEDQVRRFAAVQSFMADSLGASYAALRDRAAEFEGMREGEKRPDFRKIFSSFKGLGAPLVEAKRLQVLALNAQGFSLAEYRWVRESVYRALGRERMGLYIEDLAEPRGRPAGDAGEEPPLPSVEESVPANRDVVAPYTDRMEGWLAFLAFGL